MAKFRFALDPVLQLRQREEDLLKRDVARLESERRAIEDRIRVRQNDIAGGKESLRRSLVGPLDPIALRQQAAATIAVDRLARRAVLELAAHAQRMLKARESLTEAARRRRALELLRERRLAEWTAAQNRAEVAFLDEMAITSASRGFDALSIESTREPSAHESESHGTSS
ncbi:MAG: flagellar export protein FliJ [Phycisphaerales bacterium]